MTVKQHVPGHNGRDGTLDRRHYVWRPSPSGAGGVILGGVAGAAMGGPPGAALGALVGLVAGEALERYAPSKPSQSSGAH